MTDITSLLTMTSPGICLYSDGNEILFADENFLLIFGYMDLPKKPEFLTDILDEDVVKQIHDSFFNSTTSHNTPVVIPVKLDELRYRDVFLLGIRESSDDKKVLLLAISGSELKFRDEAKEKALSVLHTFQGIARHGILNSLTGVFLILSLLEDESESISESHYIDDFHKLLDQIKNISEYSRIYKNLGLGGPVWYNVTRVHSEISRMSRLECTYPENSCDSLEILADACFKEALDVVFQILKETSDDVERSVVIRAAEVHLVLTISYECEGEGISENDKEAIFTQNYYGKSDLALFFTRQVFNITGISIIENGTEGIGTRFLVKVPEKCFRRKIATD